MKSLLISGLVMVNVWNFWAINDTPSKNIVDFEKGLIIVHNGRAMIDNGQYYNHVTFRGLDDLGL